MGGYKNRILEVDLSSGKMDISDVSEDDKKRFIGGSGVSAKLFLDRFDIRSSAFRRKPPHDLERTSDRYESTRYVEVCRLRKSVLTGIWGESACGGNFGPELKMAGWDGIVFKGASEKPVFLLIEDSQCDSTMPQTFGGKISINDRFSEGKPWGRQAGEGLRHRASGETW